MSEYVKGLIPAVTLAFGFASGFNFASVAYQKAMEATSCKCTTDKSAKPSGEQPAAKPSIGAGSPSDK